MSANEFILIFVSTVSDPTATVSHGPRENLKKFKMEMEDPKETHIQIEDEHIDSNHNDTVRTHTS